MIEKVTQDISSLLFFSLPNNRLKMRGCPMRRGKLNMAREEIEDILKQLAIGDKVVVIRQSAGKEDLVDWMNGTVVNITKKTLVLSFDSLDNKTVKKESILSITKE